MGESCCEINLVYSGSGRRAAISPCNTMRIMGTGKKKGSNIKAVAR